MSYCCFANTMENLIPNRKITQALHTSSTITWLVGRQSLPLLPLILSAHSSKKAIKIKQGPLITNKTHFTMQQLLQFLGHRHQILVLPFRHFSGCICFKYLFIYKRYIYVTWLLCLLWLMRIQLYKFPLNIMFLTLREKP